MGRNDRHKPSKRISGYEDGEDDILIQKILVERSRIHKVRDYFFVKTRGTVTSVEQPGLTITDGNLNPSFPQPSSEDGFVLNHTKQNLNFPTNSIKTIQIIDKEL